MKLRNGIMLAAFFVALFSTQALHAAKSSEGVFYYKIGYYQQAQDILLKDLANGNGDEAEIYYYLGNIEAKYNNNPTKAAEYYTKGLGDNPKKPEVFNQIGLLSLKIKSDPAGTKEAFLKLQKDNRKNVLVAVEIGRAYLDVKDYDNASEFQGLALARGVSAPAAVLWGDINNAQGDGNIAAMSYDEAIGLDPKIYEAYVKYSRVISYVNLTVAIERLNELKAKAPELSLADKELSEIYYKRNMLDEAAAAYEQYIKAGNYVSEDLKQYAATLLLAKRYEESLKIAQEGLQREPKDPSFSRVVMMNLIDLDRIDEAKAAANHFFNNTESPIFSWMDYYYSAQLNDSLGNYVQAAEDYLQAVKLDTTENQSNLYLGAIDEYTQAGELAKSVEIFEQFIATKFAQLPEAYANNLMDMGRKYYALASSADTTKIPAAEAYAKAIETFDKVISIESDNYRGYFWKGNVLSALDPKLTKDDAKNAYIKAYEITKAKLAENSAYSSPLITCLNYLVAVSFTRYAEAEMMYKQYNQDEDKVLMDTYKVEMVKYAHELIELSPNNSNAKQIIEVFDNPEQQ